MPTLLRLSQCDTVCLAGRTRRLGVTATVHAGTVVSTNKIVQNIFNTRACLAGGVQGQASAQERDSAPARRDPGRGENEEGASQGGRS